MDEMQKYFTYVRHSGDGQKYGSSVEAQLAGRKKRAAELSAEFVDAYYIDAARSGYYGAHLEGNFKRMNEDIDAGIIRKGDIIGVDSQSRLGRLKLGEAVWQFMGLLRRGVKIDIGDKLRTWDGINGDYGFPTLVMDMNDMVVSHRHSAEISRLGLRTNNLKRERLLSGQREGVMIKARAGCFVGRNCPSWLRPLEKLSAAGFMYEVVPERREEMRKMMHWFIEMGGIAVAERANGAGIIPFVNYRRRPERWLAGWTDNMVRNILTRPAIIGLYQPHVRANAKDTDGNEIWGKRISVVATNAKGQKIRPIHYYPAVFDESDPDRGLYQEVMTSIRSRDKTGGRPKAKQFRNIVTRMVTCAVCGGRIYMHPTGIRQGRKSHDYLHCVNYRFKTVLPAGHPLAGKCCTNKYGFDCALLEEMLLTIFEPEFATVLARLLPEADCHDDTAPRRLAAAVSKLAQNERAMKRFTGLIATASDDDMIDVYDEELKKLVGETAELKRERGRWEQEIKTSAVHIDENFAKRVRAAKAKIDAADDEDRYEARAELHRVLRGRMTLELRPDRAVTVVMQAYPGAKHDMLGITFRRDCILSATRFALSANERNEN